MAEVLLGAPPSAPNPNGQGETPPYNPCGNNFVVPNSVRKECWWGGFHFSVTNHRKMKKHGVSIIYLESVFLVEVFQGDRDS